LTLNVTACSVLVSLRMSTNKWCLCCSSHNIASALFLICGEGNSYGVRYTENWKRKEKHFRLYVTVSWHWVVYWHYSSDHHTPPRAWKCFSQQQEVDSRTRMEFGFSWTWMQTYLWPWTSHLTFLSLYFFILKVKFNYNAFLFQLPWAWTT
jgi:hypothetical protein